MSDYDTRVKRNARRNEKFIDEFSSWLINKGLGTKTIKNHLRNIDFYLNHFLVYYDVVKMEDGIYEIDNFLSDWFIRKCMWSSRTSIKENAASIKKFYQCMSELNYVDVLNYKQLCEIIKDDMDYWLEALEDYENGTFFMI